MMTARIIHLAEWRATHPHRTVRLRIAFDPLWGLRLWLAFWGIK